jgi:hypothetical protein
MFSFDLPDFHDYGAIALSNLCQTQLHGSATQAYRFTLLPKMAQTRKRKVIGEEACPVHAAIAGWSLLLHPKSLSAKAGELHPQFQVFEF